VANSRIPISGGRTRPPPPPKLRGDFEGSDYDDDLPVFRGARGRAADSDSSHEQGESPPTLSGLLPDLFEQDLGSLFCAFDSLAPWQKAFMTAALPIEREQQVAWFTSLTQLLKQHNVNYPANINSEQSIIERCSDLVRQHKFMHPGGTSRVCRIVVTGPSGSGKSTFLSILARQILIDMIACGDWKETFVLVLDVASIVPFITQPAALFQTVVRFTFQAVAAQYPLFLPYCPGVVAAFENVVVDGALLPKPFTLCEDFHSIVPELRKLLALFATLWNDRTALWPFLVNTFTFPAVVAGIFGFRKYFMVVDHVDLADITVQQAPPFEEAPTNAFIIELVKLMLTSASFLISFKDSGNVANVLFPISDVSGFDLTDSITFTSPLDIVPLSPDPQNQFIISFEGNLPQLALGIIHFGGCPSFLEIWADVNRWADRLDAAMQNGGDVEETRLFLHGIIESTLRRIFLDADGSPLTVKVRSVVRVAPHV
jgi:hypothetical protein